MDFRAGSTRSSVMMDGLPLSTCCKLSAPATHHLLAHDVRHIDLAQLTMNFDWRYALRIQKLYHSRREME